MFYFIIIVNLSLRLTYKLNFIVGMYVLEKHIVYVQSDTIYGFRQPRGAWKYPPQIRGTAEVIEDVCLQQVARGCAYHRTIGQNGAVRDTKGTCYPFLVLLTGLPSPPPVVLASASLSNAP